MIVIDWQKLSCVEHSFFECGTALSIGSFDGPHLGHFSIFEKILSYSKKYGTRSGIVTFEKSLASVRQGKDYGGDIASLKERLKVFEELGFDFVVIVRFERNFSMLSGEDFFTILKETFNLSLVVEGEDFRCGHNGSFARAEIEVFCAENGIESVFVPLVTVDGKRVSSSMIRELLKKNFTKKAKSLLERKSIFRSERADD